MCIFSNQNWQILWRDIHYQQIVSICRNIVWELLYSCPASHIYSSRKTWRSINVVTKARISDGPGLEILMRNVFPCYGSAKSATFTF